MHTRFRRARPAIRRVARQTAKRARALGLKEAYRLVTVREGDKVSRLPAIQAVMRSQVAHTVRGNGPAQRAMIAAIHAMEQEFAIEAEAQKKTATAQMSHTEAARRIALLLRLAYKEKEEPMPDNLQDTVAGLAETDEAKKGA